MGDARLWRPGRFRGFCWIDSHRCPLKDKKAGCNAPGPKPLAIATGTAMLPGLFLLATLLAVLLFGCILPYGQIRRSAAGPILWPMKWYSEKSHDWLAESFEYKSA